jgi:hypothetical protein
MKVSIDIDIEKFRYSLVGDGYLLEEVKDMSEEKLISILTRRITQHINKEYDRSRRLGLLEAPRDTWCIDGDSDNNISDAYNARWSFFRGD